jgi:hypothetical protein
MINVLRLDGKWQYQQERQQQAERFSIILQSFHENILFNASQIYEFFLICKKSKVAKSFFHHFHFFLYFCTKETR